MISFKQFIFEVLRSSYEFSTPIVKSGGIYVYKFKTVDGREVKVNFDKQGINGKDWFLSFTVDDITSLTGRGDAYRILSTVINIIKEFKTMQNAKTIAFECDNTETSRLKLYRKIINKIIIDKGWTVEENNDDEDYTKFIIKT